MASPDASIDAQLRAQTEQYLEEMSDCVGLLPQLLRNYSRREGFEETAEEIRRLESQCDERNRRVSSLLSNATTREIGLRNTRLHLNSTQVLELYQRLDDIANTAERIAEELVTIRPPRIQSCFRRFQEMAEYATTAMGVLTEVIATFARLLCSWDETGTIAEGIQTIRAAESSCDRIRNVLIEDVFAGEAVADPLVYREFALLFDQLTDTIEDVTDQVVLISSSESWIGTEITHRE
jgi:uncharacterized protein Yka (UPF0111/DUF47 family)